MILPVCQLAFNAEIVTCFSLSAINGNLARTTRVLKLTRYLVRRLGFLQILFICGNTDDFVNVVKRVEDFFPQNKNR